MKYLLQKDGSVRLTSDNGKHIATYARKADADRAMATEAKASEARKKLITSNKQPESKKVIKKTEVKQTTTPNKQPDKQVNNPKPVSEKNTDYVGSKNNPKKLPEVTIVGKPKQVNGLSGGNITATLKPRGEVNQKVIDWQNKLKSEGFDLGKVDGIWGKKTEAAYQAYLKNKKRLERVGNPNDNAPFIEARQGFPTPESAYVNQNSQQNNDSKSLLQQLNENRITEAMKTPHSYLQKGGKVNGKTAPNDNDENVIPTKNEGGTDMNPKFWKKDKPKLQPKKENKKVEPIYKPKVKKAQQGTKLNFQFKGMPTLSNSTYLGAANPENAKLKLDWTSMNTTNVNFPAANNINPTISRTITNYLPSTKLANDTVYGGTDASGEFYSFNKKDNPQEYAEMRTRFNKYLKDINTQQTASRKKGGLLAKKKKKCSCGCEMVSAKGDGGKIVSKCACNCKGGKM